jgi:hypothetical protein
MTSNEICLDVVFNRRLRIFRWSALRALQRIRKAWSNANPPAERLPKRRRDLPIESKGTQMNIRLISASAATALGLMLSTGAEARTFVVYAGPAVVYVPPPRPVYYAVPVQPRYVAVVPTAPVVAVPVPARKPVVYVPMQGSYAAVPAANVRYAQPIVMVPVAGMQ